MRSLGIGIAVLLSLAGGAARAEDPAAQAKALNDKAIAEFALGDFAPAAEHYEAAFRLKPDEALLYNAAQAHRLAGHHKRALELYRSFVRVYGVNSALAPDAKRHIAEMERAVAAEPSPATPAAPSPPASPSPPPPPPAATPPAASSPPPPPAAVSPSAPPPVKLALEAPPPPPPAALQAAQPEPSSGGRSVFSSPWFWGATGAVVVAAVVLVIVLNPSYPDASIGKASGN